jgi:arginyl-tRNA--protein-N-Asp/Glu arginylyltransferase
MQPLESGSPADAILSAVESKLIMVHDQLQECPYLDGLTARMPLRLPIGKLDGAGIDALLERGYRRTGDFVYRTECDGCQACEPSRIRVDQFVWSRSLLRVLRRGDAELRIELGPTRCDPARVELFNRHRSQRDLDRGDGPIDAMGYRAFLVDSCCPSLELAIYRSQRLISVTVIDVGERSLSAVYTHFDPDFSRYSLGTYAVLKQIEYAVKTERPYVYLGMYVAQNRHLNYKARFVPQQRLIAGVWHDFGAEA